MPASRQRRLRRDPEEIEDDQARAALEAAQFDDVVSAMPYGSSHDGENGSLSGGRQRLSLARAFTAMPRCWCWMRPPALDNKTEYDVMQAWTWWDVATTIVTAHRLSTVRKCDRTMRSKTVIKGRRFRHPLPPVGQLPQMTRFETA